MNDNFGKILKSIIINMKTGDNLCCKNSYKKKIKVFKDSFFLAPIILALLPKCPFCVLAYSSTIVLCSRTTTETNTSPQTILITACFSLIVVLSIFFNKRDGRTYYALAMALSGISLIMYSVILNGGQALYYSGLLIMFCGIWYNGSFLWFMSNFQKQDNFQINKNNS